MSLAWTEDDNSIGKNLGYDINVTSDSGTNTENSVLPNLNGNAKSNIHSNIDKDKPWDNCHTLHQAEHAYYM